MYKEIIESNLDCRVLLLSIGLLTTYFFGRYSANFYNAINHKPPTGDNLNDGEAIPVKQTIIDILTSARAAEEKVSVTSGNLERNDRC